MSYLHREQRREMILNTAMQLALAEGFSALTVRRIAAEAQVSTGQVHHHFQSTSQLKSMVFIALMDQLNEFESQIKSQTWYDRVSLILGCENIENTQPYLRLWNEAEVLIEQDAELKNAYRICMERWHSALSQVIKEGVLQKEFRILPQTMTVDIAWRLIAFVCGLEGIYKLGLQGLDNHTFQQHLERMIRMELFN